MKSERERDSGKAEKEVVLVDNNNDMVTVVCDEILKGVNNHTGVKRHRIGRESCAKLISLNMIHIDCVVITVSTLNDITAMDIQQRKRIDNLRDRSVDHRDKVKEQSKVIREYQDTADTLRDEILHHTKTIYDAVGAMNQLR